MAKRAELNVEVKVVYVPLPPEMVEARRASLLMLLQWIREDMILNPDDTEEVNEFSDVSNSKKGDKSAWLIGHDGSAQQVVLDSITK